MADLLTHYVSARLPGGFIGDPAARATLILGVFLPDVAGKLMGRIFRTPDGFNAPSHTLLGLLLLSYVIALFFSAEFRARAWLTINAGALLHVAVDLLKDNLGAGSAYLLHPFTLDGYELGLYYNENVVYAMPVDLLLAALIAGLSRRWK